MTSAALLPWAQIPCQLNDSDFERLGAALRFPVLFSSNGETSASRYTIFSAGPLDFIIRQPADRLNQIHPDTMQQQYADIYAQPQTIPDNYSTLPFVCGRLGYYSYTYGEAFNNISPHKAALAFPDMYIGYYTWSYVFDHQAQSGLMTFSPRCSSELRGKILKLIEDIHSLASPVSENTQAELKWHKSQPYSSYKTAFNKVQDYILAGDCYQVNLTQRFECELNCSGDAFNAMSFYLNKQSELNTPHSAFICFSEHQHLMSFSPEQFIRIQNRVIESKPIKGTIANTEDASNIDRLQQSLKNQAENVMIVDLLRNDLSKVCKVNSVQVPELFKIETFKNVHHMVSHIRGELREDISELEAFLSCFPGGSITGAPKIRAMDIIRELELHSRSAYCGSVFYWNDNGNFDSNILIRTIIQSGDKLYCWAGGGIVADSEVEDEYLESLTKVANLTGITR